jgi:hypothetical protein
MQLFAFLINGRAAEYYYRFAAGASALLFFTSRLIIPCGSLFNIEL